MPAILPGLLGVFLASLLVAVMSSCDSFMISSSALFTENIYRPLRPDRPRSHYVNVGRVAALLIVVGGVAYALWARDVVKALELWFKIAPMTGIVFWMCLFWRRMTSAGAWTATLTGFAAWFLMTREFFVERVHSLSFAENWRLIWSDGSTMAIYEPWQILFYMLTAIVAGVSVSLLTRPVDSERLDRFYTLMRTPIVPGEQIEESCTLPENAGPPRPTLCSCCGFEIPRPSKTSVVGFLLCWVGVAALIGGFVLLVKK